MYRYFSYLKAIVLILFTGVVIYGCGTESEKSQTDATLIMGNSDVIPADTPNYNYTEACVRDYNGIIDRLISFAANFQSTLFKRLYKHYKCGNGAKLILEKEELEFIVKLSKDTRKPLNWERFGKVSNSNTNTPVKLSVDTQTFELGNILLSFFNRNIKKLSDGASIIVSNLQLVGEDWDFDSKKLGDRRLVDEVITRIAGAVKGEPFPIFIDSKLCLNISPKVTSVNYCSEN